MTARAEHGSATDPTTHGESPLHGVRVLELGSLIAGPFAGRLLAEFGAEVIKVEDPGRPDPMREWGQARKDGNALWWAVQSRNKKLITLDLDSKRGRELLLQLVDRADVLVENFRPGTLERWGIGPDVLWQRNSRPSMPECGSSIPVPPVSAGVPSRPARPATYRPRTSCGCCGARASWQTCRSTRRALFSAMRSGSGHAPASARPERVPRERSSDEGVRSARDDLHCGRRCAARDRRAGMTRVAVIGGGIGGIMAAISLRRSGLDVGVYEQAQQLSEIGAGLGLFPNAVNILFKHGLRNEVENHGTRQTGQAFRNWRTGEVIGTTDEQGFEAAFGSARYTMRRSALLGMLQRAVPSRIVHLSTQVTSVSENDSGVRVDFADGRHITADLVVGADGIGSVVADQCGLAGRPSPSGYATYRALVPRHRVPHVETDTLTTSWFGPYSHFSSYWVKGETGEPTLNVMATVESPPARANGDRQWAAPADREHVLSAFAAWHPDIRAILAVADLTLFGLYQRRVTERWNTGRVALVGDSAHAMLPFFAQGAAMALEDAEALGLLLDGVESSSEIPERLDVYSALRWERVSRCQDTAARYAREWELPDGPEQIERDRRLAAGSTGDSQGFFGSAGWLYGYDAEQAVAEALRKVLDKT